MSRCSRRTVLATIAGAVAAPGTALAQAGYPAKPVRIVVASAAGAGDDITARIVAAKLAELLGQQFFIENRPGAGGMIGQTAVAKSPPDGYTLLLAGGSMAGAHLVNANITYDLQKDFTPVSLIESGPWTFVASPQLPVRTVQEFIAYGRANPGKLNYGTIGVGQLPYWAVKMFNGMAGIEATEVAYKGIPDALTDVAAGRLDYFFPGLSNAITLKDKVRVLAVTSRVRSAQMPDVPTMAEAGLPDYEITVWRSIMGPAGLPRPIVDTLQGAMQKALASPDTREKIAATGTVAQSSTPEELRKRYVDQAATFARIARDVGLKPQ